MNLQTIVAKGDRVTLTAEAKSQISPRKEGRIGTVIGLSRDKRCAWIVWDGNKSSSHHPYWRGFLEVLKCETEPKPN